MSWSTPIPVRSNYAVYITCPDKSCTFTGVYAPFFSLSSSSGSIYYYGINFVVRFLDPPPPPLTLTLRKARLKRLSGRHHHPHLRRRRV